MIFQRFRTKLIKAAGSGRREAVAVRKVSAAIDRRALKLTHGDSREVTWAKTR